jgi:predicted phage terminase large subunit-like protein
VTATPTLKIAPQAGPQEAFLSSSADIVIYGGAAGGGKTYAQLLEPLRHVHNPRFGAVIFRREYTQVFNEGGLWDEAMELYPRLGAKPNKGKACFRFPSGATVSFAHIQLEADLLNYQGAQIALIQFDELTHFSERMFWYMLSRNRSASGVRPYVRAGTNPDPESFVAKIIAWWIDQDTGLPIPERSGVIRWFVREDGTLHWFHSVNQALEAFPGRHADDIKSFTFIPAKLEDNKKLLEKDPGYKGSLLAQNNVDRERLLNGNWKIRPAKGFYFKRDYFLPLTAKKRVPNDFETIIRYWDRAATIPTKGKPDPDWTVGTLVGRRVNGRFMVLDVVRFQGSPGTVKATILTTAKRDLETFAGVIVGIEVDPGQAGKVEAEDYIQLLAGFDVRLYPARQDKITRAGPFSAQCEGRNVDVLEGDWVDAWLSELEGFPDVPKDDQVDSASGAFNALQSRVTSLETAQEVYGW